MGRQHAPPVLFHSLVLAVIDSAGRATSREVLGSRRFRCLCTSATLMQVSYSELCPSEAQARGHGGYKGYFVRHEPPCTHMHTHIRTVTQEDRLHRYPTLSLITGRYHLPMTINERVAYTQAHTITQEERLGTPQCTALSDHRPRPSYRSTRAYSSRPQGTGGGRTRCKHRAPAYLSLLPH